MPTSNNKQTINDMPTSDMKQTRNVFLLKESYNYTINNFTINSINDNRVDSVYTLSNQICSFWNDYFTQETNPKTLFGVVDRIISSFLNLLKSG